MTTIKAFVKNHPVLSFFALAFTLSWGAVLMVGPSGFLGTKEISEVLNPFLYVAMVVGPSVAGILFTDLLYGRAGLREFEQRADERTRTADLLITSELFLLDDSLLHST